MKSTFFPVRADVFCAMSVPLCAAALLLGAASAVRAAPRSEMVTPGHKPCAERQAAAKTPQAKAPVASTAFPDRGHLPPSARVVAAGPQCATKAVS